LPSLALVGIALPACGDEPLEFADWIIEVPEGTPVREYAAEPIEQRYADAIRLTEELVIGADVSNPDEAAFEPRHEVAGVDGTIFVADSAMTRVQMYGPDGRYLRTLGNEGQGPGEFARLGSLTIAGDLLLIDDPANDRWSVWTLDGDYVRDYRKPERIAARSSGPQGVADGTLFVRSTGQRDGDTPVRLVSRLDLEGNERVRLDEMPPAPPIIPSEDWTARDVAEAFIELIGQPTRDVEVGAREIVYITPMGEYQVLAWSPEGTALWAARVAWPRPAPSSRLESLLLRRARGMNEAVTPQHFRGLVDDDAIEQLRTDGRGRLYVILKSAFAGPPPDRLPADVYDRGGALVAAGFVPVRWVEITPAALPGWDYAVGDHVYGVRETPSGEAVAVRCRLVVNER
jgi:hypothetical protein